MREKRRSSVVADKGLAAERGRMSLGNTTLSLQNLPCRKMISYQLATLLTGICHQLPFC